jgi:hypothetical protein
MWNRLVAVQRPMMISEAADYDADNQQDVQGPRYDGQDERRVEARTHPETVVGVIKMNDEAGGDDPTNSCSSFAY